MERHHDSLTQMAFTIYNMYLTPSSQCELNIDYGLCRDLVAYLSEVMTGITGQVFQDVGVQYVVCIYICKSAPQWVREFFVITTHSPLTTHQLLQYHVPHKDSLVHNLIIHQSATFF